jgi:hypothetical protein
MTPKRRDGREPALVSTVARPSLSGLLMEALAPTGQHGRSALAAGGAPASPCATSNARSVAETAEDRPKRELGASVAPPRGGERAPWLEPYGGDKQWRREMWGEIVALHGRYPEQLQALKDNGGPTSSPRRRCARSPCGEPNWTTADRTPAMSWPSRTSSLTTPRSCASRAAAPPRSGSPAPRRRSGPASRAAARERAGTPRRGVAARH